MKWLPGGQSADVEDQRSSGGGGGGFGVRNIGCGGFIILFVLSLIFKKNFFALLDTSGGGTTTAPRAEAPQETGKKGEPDKAVQFVSFVLDDVQATWTKKLSAAGQQYPHAKLVLFRDAVRSGCGVAEAASGPFYCPEDQKVYVDLGFFDDLKSRFGAPGDFAQAYVLAHEVGHHVQNLLGIAGKVRRAEQERPDAANALSVRLELQADCYAGIWAHSTQERQILEAGDVEEAMGAASAVGDDRLQKMSRGRVQPETFTHGSSKDRVEWFKRGMSTGRLDDCDTFGRGR